MLIRFFRGTGFGPIVLIVLFTGALWAGYFITPPVVTGPAGDNIMPLWSVILDSLKGFPVLSVVISLMLMVLLLLIMIRFNTSVFFINRRTYLPAFVYVLLYSIFPGQMVLNPALPAAILIMVGLWRMVEAYRHSGIAYNFFDAAMLISAGGLFYADAIWFILLALIGALLLRSPDIREITVTLAGAILPWALFYAIWYLTGKDPGELTGIIYSSLFEEAPSVYWSRTLIILLLVVVLNFLLGMFTLLPEMSSKKVKSRKTFSMLIWLLVISIIIYFAVPSVSVEILAIAAIPTAYIIANYYSFTSRITTAEILLWVMVIMLVVSRVWPY
ncbi:MAG TPA: DUF6427 family protein [Bacteroidales bacterium]|nr:DUF6427 family protein [Bacteroidales bacterium]